MAQRIVIIGGLSDDPDRQTLLDRLGQRGGPSIDWDWVKASADNHYEPPQKPLNRLLATLWGCRAKPEEAPRIVKLFKLHPRTQHALYQACPCEPVLVPREVDTSDELVEWIFSPGANLVPPREWYAGPRETALVAILCKLLKNKSWNKDPQGHAWTKEEDLLGQAPVNRSQCPLVRSEAVKMLPNLGTTLLLCKGGSHGRTPKEWCIRLKYVPVVKQAIVEQSLAKFSSLPELQSLLRYIERQDDDPYRLDGEVVTERVRQICRDQRETT